MSVSHSKTSLLYVNHSMNMGGIETMILGFLDALPDDKFTKGVAVFEGNGSLDNAVVERGSYLCDLEKKEGVDIGLIFRMRRLLVDRKVDVVHTNNFSAWFYTVLAALFLPGLVIVHTEHSLVEGNKWRRYFAEKIFAYFTRHTVAVSADVKQNMVDLCGIRAEKITVVTNGIDTDKFQFNQESRTIMRRELGIDEDCFLIGSVGRLVKVKDHATLLSAFAGLVAFHSKARLVIVGDGPERDNLQAKIEDLDLRGYVSLLGERNDIPGLLSGLDLYAVSSLSEGFSISILEAMSAGLPVVATDVGGNSEIICNNLNGLLVPALEPDQLCQAMAVMLDNGKLRYQVARNNREKIIQRFSMFSMMRHYLEMYTSR